MTVWSCESATGPKGVKAGPAASLELVDGQDQRAVVGRELPVVLEVRVLDAAGQPVPGQIVNFKVTAGDGSVFAGTASTTADGLAKERWTLGTSTADSQRVEARAVDANTGAALVFGVFRATALPDTGILTVSGGNSQLFEAGAPASDSLSVQVADKYGNPVPNVNVVWTPAEGSGSVSPTSSNTGATGFAKTLWTTAATAGTQSVSAAAVGTKGSPVVFTGTAGISPTSLVIRAGNVQSATVGTRVPLAPSVSVKDVRGNPCCAGQSVTFNAGPGQGNILGDVNVRVDASGVATVEGWVLGDVPGPMRLTATLNSLPPVAFSATALAPNIMFAVHPSSAVTDAPITPAVQVSVRDAAGNGIATNVSVTLGANPGNAQLSGTLTADAVNGVATFSGLSVNAVGAGYTLVATSAAGGGVSATSAPFNINVRTNDLWTNKAPLPEARSHFELGVVNGIIYAMGGMTGGTSSASSEHPSTGIWAYNPTSDSWSATGASSPRPSDAVGVVNGVIYSTNGTALDAYTPATNTWTTRAPLPTPVNRSTVGVVNGIVYVIGDIDTVYSPVIMQAYDPTTNSWATKSPPPMTWPIFTGRAAGLNGTLYFVDASTFSGRLLAYNPGTDTWTARGSMGVPRTDFAFASLNGLLYAVGGLVPFDPSSPHNSRRRAIVEVYDPTANAWTTLRPMSTQRNALGLVGVNGLLYAIGGDVGAANTSTDATNVNEAYTP